MKDSADNWYLSWTINRQPQFKAQDKNMVLVWVYGLTNKEGNYVKKPITDVPLSFMENELLRIVLKKIKGTDLELMVRESGLIK